jgi:CheY-like chemotaxis protein
MSYTLPMSTSVLVVEDQADIRVAVAELLEAAGYVVHCAENPDDALEALGRLPRPCILLWDAMMTRQRLSMVDAASIVGVHVATLPVSLRSNGTVGGIGRRMTKRLTSKDAILSIVHEHCPLEAASSG